MGGHELEWLGVMQMTRGGRKLGRQGRGRQGLCEKGIGKRSLAGQGMLCLKGREKGSTWLE